MKKHLLALILGMSIGMTMQGCASTRYMVNPKVCEPFGEQFDCPQDGVKQFKK